MATYHAGHKLDRVFIGGHEASFVFGRGSQIFPQAPIELSGSCQTRVVDDAGEKWFEFGFRIDAELIGNAATGWTDAGNYLRIEPQWSLDLVTWQAGKFLPAPVPVVAHGDGTWSYWSRALHPVDSAAKSGQIRIKSTNPATTGLLPGEFSGDARNNPFTSITLAGVSQPLPNFPYTMPAGAAQLQTDLRAAGWTGATVTATSATDWEIVIPTISLTSYDTINRISWPIYQSSTDPFGNPIYSDGITFFGTFVDPSGTLIVPRAFGRLQITSGTRYDPYRS